MLYILFFVIIFLCIVIKVAIDRKTKVNRYMTYDSQRELTILKERSPELEPYIKINQVPQDMNFEEMPQKFFLTVDFPQGEVGIVEIKLDDAVVSEAEQNADIKKFLMGDKLVLVYDNDETQLTEEEAHILNKAIEKNNRQLMEYTMQRANLARQLTLDDCKKIADWICGK